MAICTEEKLYGNFLNSKSHFFSDFDFLIIEQFTTFILLNVNRTIKRFNSHHMVHNVSVTKPKIAVHLVFIIH